MGFLLAGVLVAPCASWAVGSFGLTAPANGARAGARPTFSWSSASAAVSYTLTVVPTVGAALVKTDLATPSYTLGETEALTEGGGPYSWHVTAYDAQAGSKDSSTFSFFVDTTPPGSFAITSPEAGAWTTTAKAYVEWSAASDAGGIGAYRVYVDGILCDEVAATRTSASLFPSDCDPGEGSHVWAVAAVDLAGNVTWCSESPNGQAGRSFRIDDTGPSGDASGGVFMLASRNSPPSSGHSDDRMLDTGLNFNQGDTIVVSATGTWCSLNCTLGCYSVSGVSSSSGGVPASNCNHEALIGRIGGSFVCIGSNATFTASADGKLYLGDNTGNSGCSDQTITATVTGGRTFNLIGPADGTRTSYPWPTFTWEPVSDQGSGGVRYMLIVDAGAVGGLTTDLAMTVTTPLSEGTHTWRVAALDAAGNRTDSATRTLLIDTGRPSSFILDTPAREACVSLPTPNFCWHTTTDALTSTSYQLWIDNAPAASTTSSCSTPTVALAQGEHTWFVVATDGAGNTRQSSDTRNVSVDYTAPSAPVLLAPQDGSSTVDPPVFSWAAADDNLGIDHYEIYVDSALKSTVKTGAMWTAGNDLTAGPHTWYVRAYDRCGQSAQSDTWTLTAVACTPDGNVHPCAGYALGKCRTGTRTCTSPGVWGACTGAVTPSLEICNGEDDDCDGIVDNGTNACGGVCDLGHRLYDACDGPDPDQCSEGLWICTGLNSMACTETTPNNVELCNNRDDDCNGVVDDGCVTSLPDAGLPPGPDAASKPDAPLADAGSPDAPWVVIADAGPPADAGNAGDLAGTTRDAAPSPDVQVPATADAGADMATSSDMAQVVPTSDASPNGSDVLATSLGDAAQLAHEDGGGARDGAGSQVGIGEADGGAAPLDAGRGVAGSNGCSCRLGGQTDRNLPLLLTMLALGLWTRRSRRRR